MRAREPDYEGVVERDGVRVGYAVYGAGEPTILLLTSWAIMHARQWKAQVPYLARRFRVITVEGRGNGRADRPGTEEAYSDQRVRRRRDRGDGRGRGGPGRGRRTVDGRPARAAAGGLVPGAGGRGGRDRHGAALAGPAGLRRAEGQLRGLGENEPALLAGRLPRLGRVLHVAGVHRAALDQAAGGRGRLRPGDYRGDAAADRPGRGRAHRGGRRGHLPAGALPGPGRARRPGRDRALPDRRGRGGLDRRADGDVPRRRARPECDAIRSGRTCSSGISPSPWARAGRSGGPGPGAGIAASGRCTSARRSGSATCAGTWPSRPNCGPGTRTWRSTGSPSTR